MQASGESNPSDSPVMGELGLPDNSHHFDRTEYNPAYRSPTLRS
jgi:hypothetical protein